MRTSSLRRTFAPILGATLAVASAGAVATATSAVSAPAPSNCRGSGGVVTCLYTSPGDYQLALPDDVEQVSVVAVGGAGGRSKSIPGGYGQRVSDTSEVEPGRTVFITVGGAATGTGCLADIECQGGYNGGGFGGAAAGVVGPPPSAQGSPLPSQAVAAGPEPPVPMAPAVPVGRPAWRAARVPASCPAVAERQAPRPPRGPAECRSGPMAGPGPAAAALATRTVAAAGAAAFGAAAAAVPAGTCRPGSSPPAVVAEAAAGRRMRHTRQTRSARLPYGKARSRSGLRPVRTSLLPRSRSTLPAFFEAEGPNGRQITYSVTATDDVNGPVLVSCDTASGTDFAIGATTITCTASDFSGNLATKTATVSVGDSTEPDLTVPVDFTVRRHEPERSPGDLYRDRH